MARARLTYGRQTLSAYVDIRIASAVHAYCDARCVSVSEAIETLVAEALRTKAIPAVEEALALKNPVYVPKAAAREAYQAFRNQADDTDEDRI